jgi:hypothetical protein
VWQSKSPGGASLQSIEQSAIPSHRGATDSSRGVGVTFRVVEAAVPVGHCIFFSHECGSGSLAFPAPPTTLAVADRVLEVFPGSSLPVGIPRCDKRCAISPSEGSLVAFHLSFRALAAQPELLAASCEASSSSSHGVRSLFAPLSCDLPRVHSRKPRLPSVRPCQGPGSRSALVVSHHLDGLLHTEAAGLLHPADDSGVRRVSGSGFRLHPKVLRRGLRLPRAANRTLRRVPLISSRTASLRPLPSCLCCTPFASGLPGESPSGGALTVWPKPLARACALRGRSRG